VTIPLPLKVLDCLRRKNSFTQMMKTILVLVFCLLPVALGRKCWKCDYDHAGCFDHGVNEVSCPDAKVCGFNRTVNDVVCREVAACGTRVTYKRDKDGNWQPGDFFRRCYDNTDARPGTNGCTEWTQASGTFSFCEKVCDADMCNGERIPSAPCSLFWKDAALVDVNVNLG